METIKQLCKEYARDNGVTLEVIADKLDISRVALSQKLNGRTPFKLHEAFALADLVGFDVNLFRTC